MSENTLPPTPPPPSEAAAEDAPASSAYEEEMEGAAEVEAMEEAKAVEETPDLEQLQNDLASEYITSPEVEPAPAEPPQPAGDPPAEEQTQERKVAPSPVEESTALAEPDYVNGEANLEVIGYFDATYKRRFLPPREKKTITFSQGKTAYIVPSSTYGLPNAEDQDFYRAFQKIYEEYLEEHPEWTPKDPIIFATGKMLRYAERKERGRDWKAVKDWIHRQALTGLEGAVYLGKKKGYAQGVVGGAFARAAARGEQLPDGTKAETNYIWLAEWYAANIRESHYTTLIDRGLHYSFKKATAKVLCPILYHRWYVNKNEPAPFAYSSLAARLGLPPQKYLAHVKHQLDPGHKELAKQECLAKWQYAPSKDGKDWNITYWPGSAYYAYQRERRARRSLAKQIEKAIKQPLLPLLPPLEEKDPSFTTEGKTLTQLTEEARKAEAMKKEETAQYLRENVFKRRPETPPPTT